MSLTNAHLHHKNDSSNVAGELLALLFLIREDPVSNLDPDTSLDKFSVVVLRPLR
jgi:hypothetical protein